MNTTAALYHQIITPGTPLQREVLQTVYILHKKQHPNCTTTKDKINPIQEITALVAMKGAKIGSLEKEIIRMVVVTIGREMGVVNIGTEIMIREAIIHKDTAITEVGSKIMREGGTQRDMSHKEDIKDSNNISHQATAINTRKTTKSTPIPPIGISQN